MRAKSEVVLDERRAEQHVVDEPRDEDDAEAEGDGGAGADVEHVRIDERAAEVVDEDEQDEAREPCEQRLEAEPVEVLIEVKLLRLIDDVEAAAVHHPHLPLAVADGALRVGEPPVEPREEVGRADPQDAGEDVRPAHEQVEPFAHERGDVHQGLSILAVSC